MQSLTPFDVRLIAAVGRRGQLGLGGYLPWHDPEDLQFFRVKTSWSVVVMGGRTAVAVGALQHRVVRVWRGGDRVAAAAFLDSIVHHQTLPHWATDHGTRPPVIWIAGGARTYADFMPFVRRSVITHIDYDGPADVWMPPLWAPTQQGEG